MIDNLKDLIQYFVDNPCRECHGTGLVLSADEEEVPCPACKDLYSTYRWVMLLVYHLVIFDDLQLAKQRYARIPLPEQHMKEQLAQVMLHLAQGCSIRGLTVYPSSSIPEPPGPSERNLIHRITGLRWDAKDLGKKHVQVWLTWIGESLVALGDEAGFNLWEAVADYLKACGR